MCGLGTADLPDAKQALRDAGERNALSARVPGLAGRVGFPSDHVRQLCKNQVCRSVARRMRLTVGPSRQPDPSLTPALPFVQVRRQLLLMPRSFARVLRVHIVALSPARLATPVPHLGSELGRRGRVNTSHRDQFRGCVLRHGAPVGFDDLALLRRRGCWDALLHRARAGEVVGGEVL